MKTTWTALVPIVFIFAVAPALAQTDSGDFAGGVAIGSSYAGVDAAPTNGLIVQGNVGIGTSSPTYPLSLGWSGSQYSGAMLSGVNTATTFEWGAVAPGGDERASIQFNTTTGSTGSDSNIQFYTNHYNVSRAERMVIDRDGNVGIANASPAYLLHVGHHPLRASLRNFKILPVHARIIRAQVRKRFHVRRMKT